MTACGRVDQVRLLLYRQAYEQAPRWTKLSWLSFAPLDMTDENLYRATQAAVAQELAK